MRGNINLSRYQVVIMSGWLIVILLMNWLAQGNILKAICVASVSGVLALSFVLLVENLLD